MYMRITVLLLKALLGSGPRKRIWYLREHKDVNLCEYHLHVIIRQQEFIGIILFSRYLTRSGIQL